MPPHVVASLRALAHSSFVLIGVLFLGVGIADIGTGVLKTAEYRAVLAEAPPPARQPDKLFPTATEADQRRAIAQAKIGYYELHTLVGQVLAAAGVVLVAIGLVRTRLAVLRDAPAAARLR